MPVSPSGSGVFLPQAAGSEAMAGARTVQQYLKDVGLFFAAPFITLAYLVLFPLIGAALFLRRGRQSPRHPSPGRG